jgi:predicted TPR repeat methyltransferase
MGEIEQALRLAPRDGLVLLRAAVVQERAGQRKAAVRDLRAAIEAGYPVEEILRTPPLRAVREDADIARMIADRRDGSVR